MDLVRLDQYNEHTEEEHKAKAKLSSMKPIMKGTTFRKEAVLRCVNVQYL